jgi:hypothetical protein
MDIITLPADEDPKDHLRYEEILNLCLYAILSTIHCMRRGWDSNICKQWAVFGVSLGISLLIISDIFGIIHFCP